MRAQEECEISPSSLSILRQTRAGTAKSEHVAPIRTRFQKILFSPDSSPSAVVEDSFLQDGFLKVCLCVFLADRFKHSESCLAWRKRQEVDEKTLKLMTLMLLLLFHGLWSNIECHFVVLDLFNYT